MDLSEFLSRPQLRPGEARLPWDDQEFSARMLAEHLDDRPRMFGSTTWFHYQLAEAVHQTGLVLDERFGDLAGAAASGAGDFETLVLRRS